MSYEVKGNLKQRKVRGNLRWVDIWTEDGNKKTHTLTTEEYQSLQDSEPGMIEAAIIPEDGESIDVPLEDQIKAVSVPVEIVKEIPPFYQDGDCLEIWGTVKSFRFGESVHDSYVTVESIDKKHTQECVIGSKTMLGAIAARAKQSIKWKPFWNNSDVRDDIVNTIVEEEIPTLFRIHNKGVQEPVIFGILSERWLKVKISDLESVLEQAKEELGATELNITPSDGLHGGTGLMTFRQSDMVQASVFITAGMLNGLSSVRVWGRMTVLRCKNELTAAVSEKVRPMVGANFNLRKVHAGDHIDIIETIKTAMTNVESMAEQWTKAKDIKLSDKEAGRILDYYNSKAILSKRTGLNILKLYKDEEIAHEPGTLWGLAMAVSWLGTHGDVKDGVRASLKSLAGEMVAVASNWDEYWDLVGTKPEA